MIALGHLFSQFSFEVGMPRYPKSLKTYYVFSILLISANLPTRGYMIEYLINLALNLDPKILQKSTSEAPKIDSKGHRQHDASWHGIWHPLGEDFGGFWLQLGSQDGTKFPPKSVKHRSKNEVEKASENCSRNSHAERPRPVRAGGGWVP